MHNPLNNPELSARIRASIGLPRPARRVIKPKGSKPCKCGRRISATADKCADCAGVVQDDVRRAA